MNIQFVNVNEYSFSFMSFLIQKVILYHAIANDKGIWVFYNDEKTEISCPDMHLNPSHLLLLVPLNENCQVLINFSVCLIRFDVVVD